MIFDLIYLPAIILITLIVVHTNRKKVNHKIRTLLFIYLATNFLIELIANILTTNIVLYNAGMIFEVTIFLAIFYKSIPLIRIKKVIVYMIILFEAYAIINALLFQSVVTFYSYTYFLGSFFLMLTTLYYLFFIVIKFETVNPLKDFLFWFSIGVLFCYLGNLPYLSVVNNVISIDDRSVNYSLATISKVVNTLLYLLIIIGSLCQVNTKNSAM